MMKLTFDSSRFLTDWDIEIKYWAANGKILPSGGMSIFNHEAGLSKDYLPEPYYGNIENPSIVVLNINPGSSSPNEQTKHFSSKTAVNTLTYNLIHTFGGLYSGFQKTYSPFLCTNHNVPGVDWWKDNRINFLNWVVRKCSRNSYADTAPFALEMCPLHSMTTSDINFAKKKFFPAYCQNWIEPMIYAITKSSVPFAVAFSSKISYILTHNDKYRFASLKKWKNPDKAMWCELLSIGDISINGANPVNVYVFVIWQQGSMIKMTDNVFKNAESWLSDVMDECQNNYF